MKRLEKMSGGKGKARKMKKAISVLRNYAGYREFNKYILIWYDWIIKKAFVREGNILVNKGIIRNMEDIYYMTLKCFGRCACFLRYCGRTREDCFKNGGCQY